MSAPLRQRAEAMANRLETAALRAGLDDDGAATILDAYRTAMRPRERSLADDHHIDYLHPARTTLILLEDLGITEPTILAAGALTETLRPELAVTGAPEGRADDPRILALVDEVPVPARDGDELLERLVVADEAVRLIALAERLDHVRHLHLRPEAEWAVLHAETREIYLPVAERTHPTLARRYGWWCRTFAERYLREPVPGRD